MSSFERLSALFGLQPGLRKHFRITAIELDVEEASEEVDIPELGGDVGDSQVLDPDLDVKVSLQNQCLALYPDGGLSYT